MTFGMFPAPRLFWQGDSREAVAILTATWLKGMWAKTARRHRMMWVLSALGCLFATAPAAQPPSLTGAAVLLDIKGPIGPAGSDYFARSATRAEEAGARLIILRLDTPGGLDTAMRDIIRRILASSIPVVTYVAPSGARAASAGTYILYASHVAAMAPATNIGAATPVQLGGPALPGDDGTETGNDDGGDADKSDKPVDEEGGAMARKMRNDAVAYIRSLAELRGRNADWAERAVTEAASLTAEKALAENVIDVIAADVPALLAAIDGREIRVDQRPVKLDTADLQVVELAPDWRTRLLATLTDPNVAYILMLVGIYGLIFEFSNPGAIVPGVVGVICLLLALLAFQALPISYAGAGLMVLGALLMVAEMFAPSFGALGLGGVVALVLGSIMLIDTDVPGFGIDPALIWAVGLLSGLLFTALMVVLGRARRARLVTGPEALLEEEAVALEAFEGEGRVRLHGELWTAVSDRPVQAGERLRVVERDGLRLRVTPANNGQSREDR